MKNGSTAKTIIFSWIAEEGEHEAMFEIDPDNSIIELDEDDDNMNNIVTITLDIESDPFASCDAIMGTSVFILMLVVLLLNILKRKIQL